MLEIIFGTLALLSFALFCWQWISGMRFPLHARLPSSAIHKSFTVLKPLKGCDTETAECLRSWLMQSHPAPVQILFGVQSPNDPVCDIVRGLIAKHPHGELIICPKQLGPNLKVSTLVQLENCIRNELVVVSDADVWAPPDLLTQLEASLQKATLACCFYELPAANTAMRLEAFTTNSDFWSQVLQATVLKPINFALGAVMAIKREALSSVGGFHPLLEYLADDYQLGHRVAKAGMLVSLCSVVVQCRSAQSNCRAVWRHQLRWARTIRASQPVPFFFSILSNPTIWPLFWLVASPSGMVTWIVVTLIELRSLAGTLLERKLTGRLQATSILLAPLSDLFRAVFWLLAFVGNRVTWRGRDFRVTAGGKLVQLN